MRSLLLAFLVLAGLTANVQTSAASDVRMFVRHEVADYAIWLKAYNAFNKERRKMGVRGAAVYRSLDNPNDVTVTHDFRKAETAKAFATSARLKEVMEKAGVKGTPQIWFTNNPDNRNVNMWLM